jgi:hypothetical protein
MRPYRYLGILEFSACLLACGGSSNNGAPAQMGGGDLTIVAATLADGGVSSECAGLLPAASGQVMTASMGSCTSGMNPPMSSDMPMPDMPPMGMGMDMPGTAGGMMMPMPSSSGGPVLMMQDGSTACGGCIQGQWFDAMGAASTSSFTLLRGFTGGSLEAFALIGGGVAIRRSVADGSQWLATLDADSTSPQAAPAWLAPDTSLAIVRGGSAYALLPAANAVSCSASVAILSPSGTRCGQLTAPSGGATSGCTMSVSVDGTLIQMQPAEGAMMNCTLRTWPGALQ